MNAFAHETCRENVKRISTLIIDLSVHPKVKCAVDCAYALVAYYTHTQAHDIKISCECEGKIM